MYDWMELVKYTTGKRIKHKIITGSEMRAGPYLLDGHDPESCDLCQWEYFGCYFHGHTRKEWKQKDQQTDR